MMVRGGALCLVLACWASAQKGPPKQPAFNPKAYAASRFKVTQQQFSHGDVTIRVVEVKSKEVQAEPHFCRAWLDVEKEGSLIRRFYYGDIEPVGFSYGIFVPKTQPLDDFFVAVKEGDYDGRLLLVAKDGSVSELPGGFYFLTSDKRFLVGDYATDDSALVVVDVALRRLVIDSRNDSTVPEILDWYHDPSGYFFNTKDDSYKGWPPRAQAGTVYRLDLTRRNVSKTSMGASELASAHKVTYDFDPRQKKDCTATPQ
jgi:hypothetical protein